MKITSRGNTYTFNMENVEKWKVLEVEQRSNLHYGWGILIFLVFWPGLIIYAFVGSRELYTIELQFKDGHTHTTRVYGKDLSLMETFTRKGGKWKYC